jgi:hypothetical protein
VLINNAPFAPTASADAAQTLHSQCVSGASGVWAGVSLKPAHKKPKPYVTDGGQSAGVTLDSEIDRISRSSRSKSTQVESIDESV